MLAIDPVQHSALPMRGRGRCGNCVACQDSGERDPHGNEEKRCYTHGHIVQTRFPACRDGYRVSERCREASRRYNATHPRAPRVRTPRVALLQDPTVPLSRRISAARNCLKVARCNREQALIERWTDTLTALLYERDEIGLRLLDRPVPPATAPTKLLASKTTRAAVAHLERPSPPPPSPPSRCPHCGGELRKSREDFMCVRCWTTQEDRTPVAIGRSSGGMVFFAMNRVHKWEARG